MAPVRRAFVRTKGNRMSARIARAVVAFALASLVFVPSGAVSARERYSRALEARFDVPPGDEIAIDGDNANFTVNATAARRQAGASGKRGTTLENTSSAATNAIVISGTAYADSGELLASLRLHADRRSGKTIVRFDSSLRGRPESYSGDFTVTLPNDRALAITTTNGNARVDGARGRLTIETTNGTIDVRGARSDIALTTTNGSIAADLDAAWQGSHVDLKATNGNLDLAVPHAIRASLAAETTNGVVRNLANLPLTLANAVSFRLSSVNGNVTVR